MHSKSKSQRGNHKINFKKSGNKRKWKHNLPKLMRGSKSSTKREVSIDKHLH